MADPLKRSVDLTLVLSTAILWLPLIAALATAVWLVGGRPFFGHVRVGRGGAAFRCWKLRTMACDADAVLRTHLAENPAAAAEWAQTRKLRRDPRVTWLGGVLRASSLDELPQLWNVLRGDMSLVGPRPITRQELRDYGPGAVAYTAVRPGITGPWQVRGRNRLSMAERRAYDVEYAQTWSLGGDMRILFRTAIVVLAGTGL
ncbi:MAG: sugar transferase [Pseudomonadota bacterium]